MQTKTTYRNHRSKMALLLALMLILIVSAACSSNKDNENNAASDPGTNVETPAPDNEAEVEPTPEPTPDPTPEPETPTNNVTPPADDDAPVTLKPMSGEGRFVGIMDTHSVEIETADGPTAFQYEDAMTGTIEAIAEDAQVSFTYVEMTQQAGGEQVTQRWLQTIEEK